jgi:CRP-like cAMP-binding protein
MSETLEVVSGTVQQQLMVRALMGGLGDFFQDGIVKRFATLVHDIYVRQGDVIYRAGDPSDHLYFLLEGVVTLEAPDETPWRMGPSSLLGILDAQMERPRTRTATVLEDVHALVITTENWFDMIEDHFEVSREMLMRNSRRIYQIAIEVGPHAFEGLAAPEAEREGSSLFPPSQSARRSNGQLNLFERLLTLRLSAPFQRAGMQPLIRLARAAETRGLAKDELLFRPGDHGSSMFIVATGRMTMEVDDPPMRATFGPGDPLGGFAVFMRGERAFRARADTPCVVLEIDFDDLDDVMEDHFDLVRSAQSFLAGARERIQRIQAPT